MQRNIVRGVLSVVSAKAATLVVGLVTTPLLYRMLGPAQFGEYTTVLSTHSLFMILVSSGVTSGVRKYVAEESRWPDWEADVVGFYFRLAIGLALLGAAVYVLALRTGLVARVFGPAFETYFALTVVLVVTAQLWAFARRALMGFGLEHVSEPLLVVYRATFAAVALGLVFLGYGVLGALGGQVAATALVAVLGLALLAREVPVASFVSLAPSRFPRKQLLTFNLLSVLLTFLLTSLYHVDVIMLQTMRGSQQVGNYKAALTLAEFLWFVPMALQAVYVHSASSLWSQNRRRHVSDLATRTTRYTLLLTAVMALGLASLAHVVVPLYWGPEAAPAVVPLLLLLPGAVGFAVVRPTLAIEQGHGDLRFATIATGLAALVNVVLNAILIPELGMRGAAIATSVGYGSMLAFHVWSARKIEIDPLTDARLGRIALTTVLAAIPIALLPRWFASDLVTLAVVPPVGLVAYVGLSFLTGALDPDEVLDILSGFPDPVGSGADRLQSRVRALDIRGLGVDVSRLLFAAGVLLFVAGVAVSAVQFVGGPTDGPGATANATRSPSPTPGPSATTTQTPTETTTTTETTTQTPTDTTTTTQTTTQTPTDTTTTTETTTSTNDTSTNTTTTTTSGGFFG
ncbi:MAG: polysaccharide biosynthesis C-terminal domain-containing protein [Haloarculaceae archaeon]